MRLIPLIILSLSSIPAAVSASTASAPSCTAVEPAPVATQNLLNAWLQELRNYAPVLQAGVQALAAVDAADKAAAALPAIRAVEEGDEAIRSAARAMEAAHCYPDEVLGRADVVQAMQALPIGRYHAERARLLRAGCFGNTVLFVALTGQEGRFSPEQLAAPISDTERVTLVKMAQVNELLAAVHMEADTQNAGRELLPLVRDISAAMPTMSPAALCEAERLRQTTDSHLARITSNYLLKSRLIEAMLLEQKNSYLVDSLQTTGASFAILGLTEHPSSPVSRWPSSQKLAQEYRAAHAEAVEAFCRAHGLSGGDGATPDTAFELPRGLAPAQWRALLRRFGHEGLGDSFVPYIDSCPRHERKDGRPCTYVSGYAGRTGDMNHCGDKSILVPYYFIIP